MFTSNQGTRQLCGYEEWRYNEICSKPQFLNNLCSMYPIQLSKTVRLPLKLTKSILDEIPDLKIVYLVRDPRANLQSRKGRDWCVETPSCQNPEYLCNDLVNDFYSFLALRRMYHNRIK